MGAASPGRWQSWHLFCKIGRTSLLKVTFGAAAAQTARARANPNRRIGLLYVRAAYIITCPQAMGRSTIVVSANLTRIHGRDSMKLRSKRLILAVMVSAPLAA